MTPDYTNKFPGYQIIEPLGETNYSSVYRARKQGQEETVIIKVVMGRNLSSEQIARLHHEYKLIRSIQIDGIIKPLDLISYDGMPAIVLEDFGGISLKQVIPNGFSTERFLKLAIRLAEILGELHQNNISHRDIKPSNILWNQEADILKITDFGISEIIQINEEINNSTMIEGTLVYISPEQTGRMNCGVDYRSDLYSLGVTFYEMLTGTVPFKSKNAMEILHAHIAKLPEPPRELSSDIPKAISDIVMKLLSKSAAKRYQNCLGLASDLKECLWRLQRSGRIEPFDLGTKDVSLRFIIPRMLVGREKELTLLHSAFGRISRGTAEMILVSGEPGIGKSALVNDIHKSIAAGRGYFIAGKFDQFLRTVPYGAIIQAFQSLVRQLLAESDAQLQQRKEELLTVLGPNGKVITDIIPEIEVIIGRQPEIPELGPEETKNRFHMVFKNVVRKLADEKHPLVLFLDDLQWADSASLNLIENILMDQTLRFLLFIGAYRDSEVSAHHPWMRTQDALAAAGMKVGTIKLGVLGCEAVNQLILSMVRCEPDASLPLAEAIHEKTKGSPFFIRQFLRTLYDKEYFRPDPGRGWTWNLAEIQSLRATENVVTFMAERLHELPPPTLEILRSSACIGNRFDLETLIPIVDRTREEIYAIVVELLQKELITRENDSYRFYHDRIREAAYSHLSQSEKEKLHYAIGMLDLSQVPEDQLFRRIFYICDQLNQAGKFLDNPEERINLAGLNLKAGIKAKESTAYSAATSYLQMGANLLSEDSWQTCYDLTYSIFIELMESQYLNRNFEEAERLFDIIIANAKDKIDKARAYKTMIVLYTNTQRVREAIELGITALKLFGTNFRIDVGKAPVLFKLIQTRRLLKKVGIDNILKLPDLQNKELIARHQIMVSLSTCAYYVNPNLFALITLEGIQTVLKNGLTPHAGLTFVSMANIIQTVSGNYDLAFRIGEMALRLNDRLNDRRTAGRLHHLFAFFIHHWKRSLKSELEIYPKGFELSMNTGDFIYAGHSITSAVSCRFMLGHRLDDISSELEKYHDFMVLLKDPLTANLYRISKQNIKALKGLTPIKHDLSDENFDYSKELEELRSKGNLFGLCYMLYAKLFLLLFFRKFKEAYPLAEEITQLIDVPMGTMLVPYHYYYYSLILIGLLKEGGPCPRRKYKAIIRSNQKKMRKWAAGCPENFQHKYDLVAAGMADLNGGFLDAVDLYKAAIEGARKNGFRPSEIIACELLGEVYLARNYKDEAGVYIRRAYRNCISWGATAKADDLKERFPDFVNMEKGIISTGPHSLTATSESTSSRNLDFSTVMQVSQVISSEIMLDRLLANVMHLSIANAGAQRGYLILESEGRLRVQASEDVDDNESQVLQNIALDACKGLSPAIVNFVYHSEKPLILGNAMDQGAFTNDPHVLAARCKSVLCMPLLNKGLLMGILYMENNLTTDVFTPEHLEILRVISSQAAISIQNARLYKNITTEIAVRKEAEEAMRTSEEKYRTILEEMQDAYFETDLQGVITFVNPCSCLLTGYNEDELIGRNIHPGLKSAGPKSFEWYLHEIYVTGKPGMPLSCDFSGKNGRMISLEIVVSPIRDKAGKIIGYRSVGRDVSERNRLEQDLLESFKHVQNARMATILGLAKLAEYRDEETGSHLERMREYALILARELAKNPKYREYITPEYIEDIYNSAILHDIGKVGVPDAILLKPGKLTPDEFQIIKTHSTLGGDALREIEAKIPGQTFLTLSKEIAYYHHEKWDGTGYPEGLKGDYIPLSARIVALADVYDALTSKRTYKKAFSHQKAVDIIVKDRGTHFAPDVVDAFLVHAETFRRIRQELHDDKRL